MSRSLEPAHVVGPGTHELIVSARACPALDRHGIVVTGVSDACAPYRMARFPTRHTEVLVCFDGYGMELVDTSWVRFGEGQRSISQAGDAQSFHAIAKQRWGFAWVQYQPGALTVPRGTAHLAAGDPEPLRTTINMLYRETLGAADAGALEQLAALLHTWVRRLVGHDDRDLRVTKLLDVVGTRLADTWTLPKLARMAGVTPEHLRRLFRADIGESPMRRVTGLRMQKAAALLLRGDTKVEAVASAVGYPSVYAFSTAFKRVMGCPPSRYRSLSHQPSKLHPSARSTRP